MKETDQGIVKTMRCAVRFVLRRYHETIPAGVTGGCNQGMLLSV
jgi:hypothetical protein